MTTLPNALLVALLAASVVVRLNHHGVSPFNFRGAAYAYGEAISICAIPIVLGIAWNRNRGEAKILKWVYVAATVAMIIVLFSASMQEANNAHTAVAPSASMRPPTPTVEVPAASNPFDSLPSAPRDPGDRNACDGPFADLVPKCPQYNSATSPAPTTPPRNEYQGAAPDVNGSGIYKCADTSGRVLYTSEPRDCASRATR